VRRGRVSLRLFTQRPPGPGYTPRTSAKGVTVPLATVEDLRTLLDWPDVRRVDNRDYGMTTLRVMPPARELAPIDFAFRGDAEFLECLGFGEWHAHPGLDEAIVIADDLVRHRKCILEERDRGNGRYLGSGLVGPRDVRDMVRGRGSTFRRVFFGREPAEERIDFAQYVECDYGLILRRSAESLARSHRQLGTPLPDWLRRLENANEPPARPRSKPVR
jgi:hypothetical protein